MIYMEPDSLGWLPFIESWIPTCNPVWAQGRGKFLLTLFQWLVPPCLYFINKHSVQYCKPGNISLVINMMNLVEMFMNDAVVGGTKADEIPKFLDIWFQAAFMEAGNIFIICNLHKHIKDVLIYR